MKKSLRLSGTTLAATLLVVYSAFSNTYTVTTTADSGAGSLRQAITDANANAGPDDIVFNIPGGGPWSITVTTALPALTGPTVIDGTTQPGFTSGTQATYVKVGTAFTGTIFSASTVTGITIKGLDLSYSTPRQGTGISFSTCNQTVVQDNFIRNRSTGIVISGGTNHTVQNNDFVGSGQDINQPAIYLSGITDGGIAVGGVSGNKFGGSANQGFRIQNMNNLIIGDASVSGAHIVIEDNSGMTAHGAGGQYLLFLLTVNNITIDNVDFSWSSSSQANSLGIVVSNQVYNSTLTIKNCSVKNRWGGIAVANGKDVTIQNNDFRGTGANDNYAVEISNLTEANVPGGILMSGNLWGRNTVGNVESDGALKISNTNNLTIGDAATGVQIKLEDNSGLNTVRGNNTNRGPLFLSNVSNITVDNVDASWSLATTAQANSLGIRFDNTGSNGNITIKNCDVKNRYMGIYCSDGKDYTLTNNDLRGCGDQNVYAMSLLNIAEGMIPGGVLVHSNLWGQNPTGPVNSRGGLYVADMSNLVIGDAATGVHIKIEDNSGFNTIEGNDANYRGCLWLERVSNITVDNIDASYTLSGVPNSFGIFVQNETGNLSSQSTAHRNITIKNCDTRNRGQGIRIRGGKDYTVANNDMRGCGEHGNYSLSLINIQAGSMAGGILAHSNLFGTNGATVSNNGVYIERMSDLTIGDATTGVHIKLEDASGLNTVVANDVNNRGALFLNTVNNITVDNVDCSKSTSGQSNSWGIRVANTAINMNVTIKDCLAGNRARGIWIDGGRDYTLTGNNMVGSGNGNPALELSNIAPGALMGGISAGGNTFGTPNFHRGVVISNMRNLLIGDASVVGANIVLEDNCGLNQCVGGGYTSQHGALYMAAVSDVTVDNVDCSKSTAGAGNSYAIYVTNGATDKNVTIKNCKADNRYRGIYCQGGKDFTVQNNTITNSGWDGEACALDFRNISAGALTGGVLVSGNTFGNVPITANLSRAAVRFDNMRDLTIGDAATGGNVKLEDGNGLTEVGIEQNSQYVVLNFNDVGNSTIDNLNLSYSGANQVGNALRIGNQAGLGTMTIKDCTINNRRMGIYIAGGKDYTVTGNSLTGTGQNDAFDTNNGGAAVWLNGLVKGTLDGGIAMSGNTFGGTNANCALRIDDMRGFTIGDSAGDDIRFEDGTSGLTNVGNASNSNTYVLYLGQVADVTMNSVDLTRTGGSQLGGGIRVANGNGNKTVAFTNNSIGNRRTGIYISGGSDYTVTGNDLTSTGNLIGEPALYFNTITAGSLPGGISVSGNTFGGTNANCAARFESMKNITIGDASVVGRNVTFEDGTSGLTNTGNAANSNTAVLYFNNVSSSSIDNVDLSRSGGTQFGTGIQILNSDDDQSFTIKNCAVGTRRTGISIAGGKGYILQDNNLSGSGTNTNEPALYLDNLASVSGLSATGNTFGGTNFGAGLLVEDISDLIIGDATVSGAHLVFLPGSNLREATSRSIQLDNTNRVKIEALDLTYGSTKAGTGIYVSSGTNADIKNVTVQNRTDGVHLASGTGHTISCSSFSSNTDAIQADVNATNAIVSQCSFSGNTAYAINAAAALNGENNYFGGAAPIVGTPNGVTASVDATPFLAAPPAGCPTAGFPEIEVYGNLTLIADGDAAPGTLDHTDFGSAKPGTAVSRTFTIKNIGFANLNITSISFSGANMGEFVPGALTPASPIPAGSSATFTVAFTPGAAGLRTATLDIVSDDVDEAAFDAAVQGTGKNVLVVTKTADTNDGMCDADCSLREAITAANSNADADVITFAIGSGAQTITHITAFPNITQPLTIDGTTQPGYAGTPLITVNSNYGSATTFNVSGVTGFTVKSMNLSRPDANFDGTGISLTNCNTVTIQNNVIRNRVAGIATNGGYDYTIQNNDLKNTGWRENEPAIWLRSLTSRTISGGVTMSGNVWGDLAGASNYQAGCALRIDNMSGLIIGDASVSGRHITIEDVNSGWNDVQAVATNNSQATLLYLSNVADITVDNVDMSQTSTTQNGTAIAIASGSRNVTVKNCPMQYRYRGINCEGGQDYTLQNNDIRNTGYGADWAAIRMNGVTSGSIPAGVTATGNQFGGTANYLGTVLRILGMSGLTIGDAGVAGAHIVIPDSELSDFKGTNNSGQEEILSFNNVSDLTIDNVDLTHGTVGNSGYAIAIANSANNRNVTIKNCAIQYRHRGIYLSGGKDYTVQNNNLAHTGSDINNPAIYLTGIRPGALAAGVVASGNTYGYTAGSVNAKTALRVTNMDGLLIGDAGVAGAHIVIEDGSGAKNLNNTGDTEAAIYMSAVSNITVDNVDVSYTPSGRAGAGIWVENNGNSLYRNVTIKNCKIQQRHTGIWVNGGKDATIQNNDLRYSGFYNSRPAIYLNNIQFGTLPGGISMSGNLFGGTANGSTANMGITITNMSDLVISDGSLGGTNILLEDGSGLNEIVGDDVNSRGSLYMSNVRNVQINSVDMSKATGSQANSFALYVDNSVNVSATNNSGANRFRGFYFSGGRDYTVTGNNLTSCGQSRDNPALYLNSIQPGSIHTASGISAALNTFGGSTVRTALRLDVMKNVLIGDASVAGAHIVIEDASGMNNCTQTDNNSDHPVIYLVSVADITVDNVDASRPSGKDKGGIWVNNGTTTTFGNVAIKNCNFNNHRRGIYISGGRDYTVQNNSLLNGGQDSNEPAIYLQNIQARNLPGGILMSGNTFGGTTAFAGIRFENMRDLYVGDATTGTNVKIEDGSGLNNMGGNGSGSGYHVLQFVNVLNSTVDNVDVSRPVGATPAQDFTGIRVDNGAAYGPITVKNCDVRRHRIGINFQGGKDYTTTGNDLRGCGVGNNLAEPALYFANVTQLDGTVPMGIAASGNLFGTANGIVSNLGLRIDNSCGILISDGTVANTHIALEPANGIKEVTGTNNAVIYLSNNSGMTLEKVDLEFTGTQTGTGIRFQNSNASQYGNVIKDNILKNRRLGLRVENGADYTVTGNNFQMSGAADNEPALYLEHVAEGALSGGVSISGNTFGGTGAAFGLKFVNMSNLKISNGSVVGTNVNLGAWATNGIGNLTTGNALHLSGICNALVSTLDLSRSGTTRQGTGLRLTDGMGNTIEKVFVQGRDLGIVVNGSVSEAIQCNAVYDNNFGFDFPNSTTIKTLTFQNNSMHCNTTGLRNQRSAALGVLNVQSNYWGAATGPTNLGGTGNGYTNTNAGSVNATSFLTAAAACAPVLPNTDALGNAMLIEDGDMTPSFNDNTLFCGVAVGQTRTITYTLKNNGGGTIRLDGASPVSTTPATEFVVVVQPVDLELTPGESTTFDINFTPTGVGTFTATVDIQNRTCDNDPYNFTIQGQGCTAYNATLSGTPSICIGQSASITIDISGGTAPFTIKLSDGSTHVVNSIGTHQLMVSPAANTSYTLVQVYDANNCCADLFGSASVTVNPLPMPAITVTDISGNSINDGIICADGSAMLDAGMYNAYLWSTSATSQSISVNTAGTYTVQVTDANTCQNTATATIVVHPNPTPIITETDNSGTANDDIICAGGSATLDAGGGYSTYAWMPSGNTQTIMVSAGGTYTVVVTDANGCTGTDNHAIQENALPVAALSGALLVCPGTTSANLDLNITAGTAPFTVTLSDASVHNVPASGMSTLSVTVAGPGTNSFTISSITGAGGCAGSGSGTATVDFGSTGEIEISGNSTPIADGDNMPDAGDHTDFGLVAVNGSLTRTFTITNSHPTLPLGISGVNITGTTAFTLMTPPASSVAANGGTTTFVVKFAPTALGLVSATVVVNSSDCDEEPYDFAVTGKGATPASALSFDGVDDYITTSNNTTLDLSTQTVEFWAKPSGSGDNDLLVGKRNYGGTNNNDIRWSIHFQNGNQGLYFYSPAGQAVWAYTFTPNQWYHIAMVTDATSTKLYIDGTFISSKATTINSPTNLPVIFGASGPNFEVFPGSLDEVRIWNTTRTCEEITQLRNCELTGSESGLMAYYKFNQGFAAEDNTTPPVNTLTDATANANNGTLNGFALNGATSNWVAPGGVTTGTSCPLTITAPEAHVQGGLPLATIADGDNTPSTADSTDFGLVAVNGSLARSFTIFNTGDAALTITSITSDNVKFVVSGAPASVAAGSSATFTVTFNPTALGVQNATITISTNDCDEAVYDFAVTGRGATPASALHFDGMNDNVSIPDHAALQLDQFTLETWFNPSTAADFPALPPALIAKGAAGSPDYFMVPMFNTRKIAAGFWSGASFVTVLSTTDLAQNTWYHLAATFDGTTLKMYVNGVLENTVAAAGLHPQVTTNALSLGLTNATQYVNGALDEVRIWNIARTCEEIRQLRNCELMGSEDGLVAYYKFNQGFANENNGAVTTLADAATTLGGANNGTLNGFTLSGPASNWVTPGGVTTGTSCPAMITYPEADLLGHDNTPLADGTTSTSAAQGTNLGSVNLGSSSAVKTFTIQNNGTAALTINSIASSDAQFTVTALSPASPVPVGMPATFTLTFTPTATGVQNATITIDNDDCDEAIYTFAVTGTGVCVPPSFTACPTGPLTANTVTGTCAAPVNYTVTEAGNPAPTVAYAFTGATTGSGSGTGTGSTFNKGNTTVTVTATSSCSPSATCSFTVTVTDNEKPQITCAAPVTINTTAELCTGTTTLIAPTVTDNCPGSNGLSFDGVNDEVTTPVSLGANANATIEAWINPSVTTNNMRIISNTAGTSSGVSLRFQGGKLQFWSVCGTWQDLSNTVIPANQWTHLAVVMNGNQVTGFINGVQGLTITCNTLIQNLGMGGSFFNNGLYYNGKMDEVRFWNVARTATEIASNMYTSISAQPGLVGLYHLNQGIAGGMNMGLTTATDDSGNGNNGTLLNFGLNNTPTSNWVVGLGVSYTNNAPATYPKGITVVTWTATDASGNTETCQQTVTVVDNQAPTLANPGNQALNVIATTCAANYTIADPVSDNCTGATWGYTLSGATTATGSGIADGTGSGLLSFNKGVTTVVLSATDGTNTATTVSFTVTVTDNEKPQITCAGPVTVNTTAGLCTGTTTLTVPNVTDNCPFGGNGLNFDGSDDQVATAAYSGTALTGDLTMECWFKGSSMNGRALIGRGFQQEFDLALWSNQLSYYHGNGSTYTEVNFNYVFADNTWYHVAVVRNAVAQTVSLYVNGVFQQTLSYGTPLPVAQTAAFRIGHRAAGNPFLGSIDEVRVWTVSRTPAQIAGNWNKELAAQPDLFALYHLNEGVANADNSGATTAADASGNAKDGTLTNFALSGTSSNWVVGAFGGVMNDAPATYPKGNTTVTWTATDASGNTETCQQTVTVTDNEVPVLTVPAANIPLNVIATTCAANYTIASPITDNCTGSTWTYALSGATTAATSSAIASGTGSGVVSFNKGVTTVTLNGVDAATNAAVQKTFTVTVTDDEKPQITCAGPVTINTTAGQCTGTTTLTAPTATDNCSGVFGNALNFDGTNDYISAGNVTQLSGATKLTLESWIYPTNGATGMVMGKGTTTSTNAINIERNGQTLYFRVCGASDSYGFVNNVLPTNTWTHIACVYDGTLTGNANRLKIYINGVLQTLSFAGVSIPASAPSSTAPLTVGAFNSSTLPLGASLDEVRIWSTARTQAEIQANMNSEISAQGGLAVLYHFNQGVAYANNAAVTTATDASGNGYTGTLSGFGLNGATSNWIAFSPTLSNNAPATYPKGITTVTWTARDDSGNTETCQQTVTVTDNEVPVLTVPAANIPLNVIATTCAANYTIASPITDNCTGATWTYTLSGATTAATSSAIASGTSSGVVSFNKGVTTVTLNGVDAANNAAVQKTFTVTVTDNEAPNVTACFGTNISAFGQATGNSFTTPANSVYQSFTAPVTGVITSIQIQLSGGASGLILRVGNGISCGGTILGSKTFNGVGGFQTITFDTPIPVTGGVMYNFGILGNHSAGWATVGSYPGGQMYYNGCPGSPALPNSDLVFTVNMNYVPPISINVAPGTCAQTYAIPAPTITDNCTGPLTWNATFSGNPNGNPTNLTGLADGSPTGLISFAKGTTNVVLNGVDANGNISTTTCPFTVTVVDNEAPTISGCATNQSFNVIATTCAANYVIPAPTLMDNCAGPLTWNAAFSGNTNGNPTNLTGLTNGAASGNVSFNKGTTTVTLTATDAANNTSTVTCSFVVTVVDNEKPTITCSANITQNTNAGTCVATVAVPLPTATDNCNPTNITNGLNFDGDNDYVTVPSAPFTSYTIETWVKFTGTSTLSQSIIYFTDGNIANFSQEILTDNAGHFQHYLWDGSARFVTGTTVAVLNTWYHVAIVATNSGLMRLYVNGVEEGTPASLGTMQVAANQLVFGKASIGLSYFKGTLDEVRIWNQVRSQVQIQSAMNIELVGNEPGLYRYHRFNEGIANGDNTALTSILATTGANGTPVNMALNGTTSNFVPGILAIPVAPTMTNNFNGTSNASGNYPKGTTTVTWTATDASGNTETCQQTVTVVDNQAPTLANPGNQALNVIATTCAANYTIADPVSDNCTGATWGYTLSGATTATGSGIADGTGSGLLSFNKGVTTVVLSATDGTNTVTTVSFTVTVTDNEKPQITCAGPVTVNTTAGLCTGTTTLIEPTVTDNCPTGGNALDFDGLKDNVITTLPADVDDIPISTWEAWIYPTIIDGGSYRMIFGVEDTGWDRFVAIVAGQFQIGTGGGPWIPTTPTLNTWQHIAVVFNEAANSIKFYKNGVEYTFSGAISHNSNVNFGIGCSQQSGPTQFFAGKIDDVRVWNFARTQAQIQASMNSELSGGETGLVGYWRFNQGVAGGNNIGITTAIATTGPNGALNNFTLNGATSNWTAGVFGGLSNNAPATYPKGNTTVTWTATDASGNTQTCQQTVTVTDIEVPVLTVPAANIPLNVIANTCAADFTIASPISDNCSGATWTYALSGATTAATSSAIADGSNATNVSFNKGVTTVTLNGVDAATNAAVQKTFTVTVTDNQMPTITCPSGSPFAKNTDPTECNYTVQGTEFNPTAFGDNCPGATITNSFNNMATLANADLPKGSTTITWTVTDGMAMSSTTCQIVVNVTDNQMPTITCPSGSPFAKNTDPTECNYTVQGTEFNPTAFGDNCPGATITNNFNNSATLANADLPKGSTTITWTVTDGMGMSSTTCEIVVNVQFPEISVHGNGMEIADGDAMPDPADHTDFGSTTGTPITRTFTIKNTGNVNLDLGAGAITITGLDMAMFTVSNITLPTSIAGPLGSVTFDVTYTPVGIGTHTATVNLASNDCDEATYDFAIQGTRNCSPPTFTACPTSPVVVNTDAGQCTAVVNYTATADGTPTPDLTYMLSGVTMGSGSGTGSGATFNKGNTTVTVTATNPCGMPTCVFTVTVSDVEKPTLTCPSSNTLTPLSGNCTYTLSGTAYDPTGLSDNCGVAGINNDFNNMASLAGAVLPTGPTLIEWTVTDVNGLTQTCQFTLTVTACVEISGTIFWKGDGVAGVNNAVVALSGEASHSDATDINGDFDLIANTGDDFVITPTKNTGGMLNGVTAADATVIQQHLTGINLITDFYRLVAADCNRSNNISSVDAGLIRQALLGSPSAMNILNAAGAWRFVHTDYVPVLAGPYVLDHYSLYNKRVLTGVSGMQPAQDFYGVKTGDVFEEMNPGVDVADPTLKPDPDAKPVVWRVRDRLLKTGQVIELDFSVVNFTDIAAFQYGMRFDPTVLQYQQANGTNAELALDEASHFGTWQIAKGELRTLWSVSAGKTLPGVQPMYRLRFKVLQGGKKLSEVLGLDPAILAALAYTTELAQREVQLVFTDYVQPGLNLPDVLAGDYFDLLQNRPNPFSDRTTIGFILPEATAAQLRVLDISGRELWRVDKAYSAGYHEETVRLDELNTTGMLFYELTTPQGTQTRKMLAVRL